MFALALLSFSLLLVSVAPLTLPRHHLSLPRRHAILPREQPPSGWATSYLEPYDQYHTRYLAIDCEAKHNTTFFNVCCHPLLATERLETARPANCIPSSPTTSAPLLAATSPANDGDCSDDPSSSTTTSSAPPKPSPSSTPPKPSPSPSPQLDPKPLPSPSPSPTHSAKPAPAPAPSPSPSPSPAPASGSGPVQSGGHATFFYQNNVAGACGTVHSDQDLVAAMDYRRYGALDVKSALCGRQVHITNTDNGQSVDVTIADACPTCDSMNSIDLSEAAFRAIAPLSAGYVPIKWTFI